jgi:hypothetical protein
MRSSLGQLYAAAAADEEADAKLLLKPSEDAAEARLRKPERLRGAREVLELRGGQKRADGGER